MPESRQKDPMGTPREQSERMLKKIQEMGNIYDFSIGSDGKTEFRFQKAKSLSLKGGKMALEVSFSSMEHENKSLLHFLLNTAKS
ncbi:MAG: hypothetical protein WAT81_05580 [Candidatus Moraniibacteriota bacterium]